MKLSFFLSVGATFLSVAATKDEPSLDEMLRSLKTDEKGVRMLGLDGVLRRVNGARDTVIGYVQLSASHVAEFTKRYPPEARGMWAGVDGRAVVADAELWAVPDDFLPRDPTGMTSKPKKKKSLLEVDAPECRSYACEDAQECMDEYNCAECDEYYECVGGPTGCLRTTRCDDTL